MVLWSPIRPPFPAAFPKGRTREEALANISEAIQGYLESLRKHGEPLPEPADTEIIEVK
jgi:antitoxin HicB